MAEDLAVDGASEGFRFVSYRPGPLLQLRFRRFDLGNCLTGTRAVRTRALFSDQRMPALFLGYNSRKFLAVKL